MVTECALDFETAIAILQVITVVRGLQSIHLEVAPCTSVYVLYII